jgi:hypothetical protein
LVGTLNVDLGDGITLQPGDSFTTEPLTVNLGMDLTDPNSPITLYDVSLADGIYFYNVTQNATVLIDGAYEVENMYYFQNEVPYNMSFPDLTAIWTPDMAIPAFCPNSLIVYAAAMNTTSNTTTIDNSTTIATTATTETVTSTVIITTTTDVAAATTTDTETTTTTDTTTTDAATTTADSTTTTPV